jgi:hypothetical protein
MDHVITALQAGRPQDQLTILRSGAKKQHGGSLHLPGQCHILHPDEMHDGGAGNNDGFVYRIVYVAPSLVQDAIRGKPLPFVRRPVVDAAVLDRSSSDLWKLDEDLDDVTRVELVVAVRTASIAAASASMRMMVPVRAKTSSAERATAAPASLSAWALAAVRFQTTRGVPAFARLSAIGSPIAPSPTKPTGADEIAVTDFLLEMLRLQSWRLWTGLS